MKNLFALLAVLGMLSFGASGIAVAQENVNQPNEQVQPTAPAPVTVEAEEDGLPLHQEIKRIFIEGGAGFMGVVLLTLIFGLAISIERILYLNFATTNTERLLLEVEEALENGGIEAAKEVCRDTRGPVASIFYQGLSKFDEGIDVVEKSVVAYGGVQTGLLEKNMTWISLFISLAPMLGFMGTVIGMIAAFDSIEAAGDISPSLVAGGIKVALITTVSGLVVAIILQVFYNYIASKIDSLVNTMEDASISLIDILVKYNLKK
jgi:biopolymer transport protein ExbB